MSLGGAIPNWVVNQVTIDMPSGILKVRDYIKRIHAHIHERGQLNCPLPLLKTMGVDLGWMDADPLNTWGTEEGAGSRWKVAVDDAESKEASLTMSADRAPDVAMDGDEMMNGTPSPALPRRAQSAYKSPSIQSGHKLNAMQRQKTWTGPNGASGSGQNGHCESKYVTLSGGDSKSGSVTSSSSRHRMPNHTLSSNVSPQSDTGHTAKGAKSGGAPRGIVVTREQWENGVTLRLADIENVGLQRSMSTILSHKKWRTRQLSGDEAEHCELGDGGADSEIVRKAEGHGHGRGGYALSSTLSVRDAASYMTLANCAVSELLQQTDPSSKNYWVPSEAKTPRGIFVYKFIHSRERYYHYMGKAILHHEPKFIFDALTDPSFRWISRQNVA